jgi:hypothetical protein
MTNNKQRNHENQTQQTIPTPTKPPKKKLKDDSVKKEPAEMDESVDFGHESDLMKKFNTVTKESVMTDADSLPQIRLRNAIYQKKEFTRAERKGYTKDSVFGEDDSLHDAVKMGKTLLEAPPAGQAIAVENWANLLDQVFHSEQAVQDPKAKHFRRTALRCINTDPIDAFEGAWDNNDQLHSNDYTNLWITSFNMLGGDLWRDRRKNSSGSTTSSTKDDQSVATEPGSNKSFAQVASTPPRPNQVRIAPVFVNPYISRPITKKKSTQQVKLDRKFTTFFKLRLPKIQTSTMQDQEIEVLTMVQKVFEKIWQLDSSFYVRQWNDGGRNTISKKGCFPLSRDTLEEYVDRIWIERSKNPWLRFIACHNIEAESFEKESIKVWMKNQGCNLYKDKLQCRSPSRVGFLLGYHPQAVNGQHLASALEMMPQLKNISVEIRVEPVVVEKGDSRDLKNKAPYIWADRDDTAACRNALSEIYSTRNGGIFPLGVSARFIPYTMDSRFITTRSALQMAKRAKNKQKLFIEKSTTLSAYSIIGLDYVLPEAKCTLRQALMTMRSVTNPEVNLFIGAEETTYTSNVILVFKNEFAQEAAMAVPGLPLIMAHHFGPRAWTWFNDQARTLTDGYEWDDRKGVIEAAVQIDSTTIPGFEELDEMDEDDASELDEQQEEEDEEMVDFTPPYRLEPGGLNQYNDNGTIESGEFQKRTPTDTTSGTTTTPSSTSTLTSGTLPPEELVNQLLADSNLLALLDQKRSQQGTAPTDGAGGE